MGALKKSVSDEKSARVVFEEAFNMLKGSVSALDELSTKLARFDKALESAFAEAAPLTEELVREDKEGMDSQEKVAEVRKDARQRMVRLIVALYGQIRAKKLTHSPMTDSIISVDAGL